MTKKTLTGKTLLITGAANGIGRALALHFAHCDAEVILLDKDDSGLDQTYDAIAALDHKSAAPMPIQLQCDLAELSEAQAEMIAEQITEQCAGGLAGLIHNAAVLGPLTPLEQYPLAQWNHLLQVNLTSAWLLTKALMPCLRSAPQASIVFTTDKVAREASAYWGAYALTKAAIETLTRLWHQELSASEGIRVNALDPGAVQTGLRAEAFPAENPSSLPEAESLLAYYEFLIQDTSAHLQGQILTTQDLKKEG